MLGVGDHNCALAIRDNISLEEPRPRARHEVDVGLPLVWSRLPANRKAWSVRTQRA